MNAHEPAERALATLHYAGSQIRLNRFREVSICVNRFLLISEGVPSIQMQPLEPGTERLKLPANSRPIE